MPKNADILECICGNNYKHMSSLCKHKKICSELNQYNMLDKNKNKTDSESYLELETESKLDYDSGISKKDLLKHNKLVECLIKENAEFKSLIMELIKKDTTAITSDK